MNLENKQRIVGIVVLVAFIALLIPFLFTSGVKKRHELAEEVTPVKLNEQKQEISEAASPPVFMQETVEEVTDQVLPDGQEQEQAVAEVQTTVVFPDQPKAVDLPEKVSSDVMVVTPSSETVDVVEEVVVDIEQPTTIPAKVERLEVKPEAKAEKKKKIIAKSGKSAVDSTMFWSVQVGSFVDQARAERMVTKLQNRGYDVYLQKITTTHKPMVRVLVGREVSKSSAAKIADQLKSKMDIDGFLTRKK